MTTLYVRKIPDLFENKRLIKSCVKDLKEEGYEEFLEENKIAKILRMFIKKDKKDYSSIAIVTETTSRIVKVFTINDPDYKMPV